MVLVNEKVAVCIRKKLLAADSFACLFTLVTDTLPAQRPHALTSTNDRHLRDWLVAPESPKGY